MSNVRASHRKRVSNVRTLHRNFANKPRTFISIYSRINAPTASRLGNKASRISDVLRKVAKFI